MASWQLQQAKQHLSEVVRAAEAGHPQTISRHGKEVAVVVELAEYRRLTGHGESFTDFLRRMPAWPTELELAEREIESERETGLFDE